MTTTPTKTILDVAPDGPVRSEPFEFKGRTWRWRLLDGREDIAARLAAQRYASDQIMASLGVDRRESLEVLQVGLGADVLTEWQDWFRMGAALTLPSGAPIIEGSTVMVAERLADEYVPLDRLDLVTRYLSFCDEHDPANIPDAELEEIIAAAGGPQGLSRLKSYGSPVLRSSLHITAKRLHEAEARLAEMEEQVDLAERVEALELTLSQMPRSLGGGASDVSSEDASSTQGDKQD